MGSRALLAVLAVLSVLSAVAAWSSQAPTAAPAPEVCHACFWTYGLDETREEVEAYYRAVPCASELCRGEVAYLLGRTSGDRARLAVAMDAYGRALAAERDPRRRLMLAGFLGLTARDAGADPRPHLETAARLAEEQGLRWRADLFRALAAGRPQPRFGEAPIRRDLTPPAGVTGFVLGESAIRLRRGARVGVQLERTFRDWLSRRLDYDFTPAYATADNVLDYHEGARLKELMEYAGAVAVPFTDTVLAARDGRWYAPDEQGVFRFHVLKDKVEYPTTKHASGIGIMTDTHGVSAVVAQAVRDKVDLVIACGDNPGKVQAAYHLGARGIPVYFPCDRELALVLGHDARAPLLGTAPVRRDGDGAVVGAQPVTFAVDEPIVVSDIAGDGAHRYYDSAWRYFSALSALLRLSLVPVKVDAVKQAHRVVEEARRRGARAIATRVAFPEDHAAVAAWLRESPRHRAVLFHSAPYPDGYRLFFEFPAQVTFGDPRPRFLTAP